MAKVSIKDRHIRWDFGPSPDTEEMVRYIFIVSGDKFDRDKNLEILVEQLQFYGGAVKEIRKSDGKTKNTKFRHVLSILDSRTSPNTIDWTKFSLLRINDKKLYERVKKGFSVENYVENLYGK